MLSVCSRLSVLEQEGLTICMDNVVGVTRAEQLDILPPDVGGT